MVEIRQNELEEEFDINPIYDEFLDTREISPSPEFLSQSWMKIWKKVYSKYRIQIEQENSEMSKMAYVERLSKLYQYHLSNHLEFLTNSIQIVSNNDLIRKNGIIYTPTPVSRFIIEWILMKELDISKNENKPLLIADIACGTGQFFSDWMKISLNYSNSSNWEFWGLDRDENAIEIANLLDFDSNHFFHSDSLFDSNLMQENQFDIILGNPPYIKSSAIPDEYWKNIRNSYSCAFSKFDLAVVFLEKIVQLLKPDGIAGLIISNKWMVSKYGKKIRKFLLDNVWIKLFVDISQLKVFHGISTYPVIIIFQKNGPQTNKIPIKQISIFKPHNLSDLNMILAGETREHNIDQAFFSLTPDNIFISDIFPQDLQLLTHFWNLDEKQFFLLKSPKSPYLLKKGIHTGNIRDKLIFSAIPPTETENPKFKIMVTSRQKVEQFKISWQGLWIHYDTTIFHRNEGDYGSLRESWIFEAQPKIVIKLFGIQLQAAIDFIQTYANNSLILLVKKIQNPSYSTPSARKCVNITAVFANLEEEFFYILGILNSGLISHYYRAMFRHTHVRGNYMQFYVKDLSKIPIIIPTKHNFKLAREIALCAKQLTTFHEEPIKNHDEILATKQKLDEKVFRLYNWKEEHPSSQ
ncbi:MAG: Eco57I restriction-modification methylase domain-containing protein [Promethearchaeota archaeon]